MHIFIFLSDYNNVFNTFKTNRSIQIVGLIMRLVCYNIVLVKEKPRFSHVIAIHSCSNIDIKSLIYSVVFIIALVDRI